MNRQIVRDVVLSLVVGSVTSLILLTGALLGIVAAAALGFVLVFLSAFVAPIRVNLGRAFWRWMGRRWRMRESQWTRAAYSASAWDEHGQVAAAYQSLYREARENADRCAQRAAACERRASRAR